MPRIVSVWFPRWPIDRALKAEPGSVPAEAPFAFVETGSRGIRITAVNRAAAAEGVRIGQGLADARAALPCLQARPAEPARDLSALRALARWCGRYGPARNIDYSVLSSETGARIERDGIWIDITGVAHLFGGEADLLRDLATRLSRLGLNAHLGLADTLGAAHALARFAAAAPGQWATAPAGEIRSRLAALPVAALRLAPEAVLVLKRLGLKRIGQLYDLPRTALERRFRIPGVTGPAMTGNVLLRLDQALGVRTEPRRPLCEPPALCLRKSWPEPLISSEALQAEAATLLAGLCQQLDIARLGARRVRLLLYRADGTVAEAAAGTSMPCRAPHHLMRLLSGKLEQLDAGFGIDLMALEAVSVERLEGVQTELRRELNSASPDGVAQLVDRLSSRLGAARITRFAPRASHIPERAEVRLPALVASFPDQEAAPPSAASRSARPPLLLARPEPIAVMAEVPEGAPARFTWRRVPRRVVRAEGPERIAPEWWRNLGGRRHRTSLGREDDEAPEERPAAIDPADRTRDYYRIEDDGGAAYWVFREGLYPSEVRPEEADVQDELTTRAPIPRWFLHGLFT